jgi:hypothetical protein
LKKCGLKVIPEHGLSVLVIKWRRVRWVGHAASMGDMRNTYKILVREPKGKDHLENLGIYGIIILK